MLSDEEKAKDILINFRKYNKYYKEEKALSITISFELKEALNEAIGVLLTVYEKQSKEIEILNKNMNLLREQNLSYKQSIHGLKEENKKYIVQLTDEQYRKLVDIIRDKTSKEWEDKIKAKIEELDEEIKVKKEIARKPMDRVSGRLLTDNIVELEKAKKVLQSLLEKE